MEITNEQVLAGQALYSRSFLAAYDFVILGFSTRLLWGCPAGRILQLYDAYTSDNHLDVGVGTGFFLDRSHFRSKVPRLALLDLNPNSLDVAARRLSRYKPEIYQANVLEPLHISASRFDSISMSGLLHCLPGTIVSKSIVFDNLKALLNPGGVIFGTTILHGGVRRGWLADRVMNYCNSRRIFTNLRDDLSGLSSVLADQLVEPSIEVAGSVALFAGVATGRANPPMQRTRGEQA